MAANKWGHLPAALPLYAALVNALGRAAAASLYACSLLWSVLLLVQGQLTAPGWAGLGFSMAGPGYPASHPPQMINGTAIHGYFDANNVSQARALTVCCMTFTAMCLCMRVFCTAGQRPAAGKALSQLTSALLQASRLCAQQDSSHQQAWLCGSLQVLCCQLPDCLGCKAAAASRHGSAAACGLVAAHLT